MERIAYTGKPNSTALRLWAAKQSKGGKYVFFAVVFSEVYAYRANRLPYSDHTANDYPAGYWHNGQHRDWSNARKIRAQNAGQTND